MKLRAHLAPLLLALLHLAVAAPPAAARQFSAPRPLPGDRGPAPAGGQEFETDLAAGAGAHLAVWVDERTNLAGVASTGGYALAKQDVFARRIDPDGAPLGLPFPVAQLPFEARRPRVAWNGVDQWLVVWEARRATQTTTYVGIRGVRVAADGTVLDPVPLVIDDDIGVDERFSDVTGQGGEWMVAWQDLDFVSGFGNVSGAIVAADGSIPHRAVLGTTNVTNQQPRYPVLEAAAGRYLVAWTHQTAAGGSNAVQGRFFGATLAPLGAEFPIGGGTSSSHATLASSGSDFLVTWDANRAAVVSPTGVVSPAGGRVLSIAAQAYSNAAPGAWIGDRWVVMSTNLDGHVLLEELGPAGAGLGWSVGLDRTDRTQDPTIAAVGTRAVALWSEDVLEWSDTACARVSAGLQIGAPSSVSAGVPNQVGVDLDGDPSRGYVLVWVDANSGARRVMLRRLVPDGSTVDPEPIVVHEVDDPALREARVAYGTTNFLVVWSGKDGQGRPVVHGKRVSTGGQVLDAVPVELLEGTTPDVDHEGTAFLVASTHEPTNHFRYVHTRRVAADGSLQDPAPVVLSSSYARFPRIASMGGRFLVVWSQYGSHDSPFASTRGAVALPAGAHGSPFAVESATGSTYGPRVAAGPQGFFVTFAADGDVRARRVLPDGTPTGAAGGFQLTYADREQGGAAAAPLGAGWLAAWTDYRAHPPLEAGLGDVYGARTGSGDVLLDPDGLPLATGPAIQGTPVLAGVGGDGMLALVAWSDVDQAFRVHTARFHGDAVGDRICSPAAPNSTGTFASLLATGSDVAFANDLTLHLDGAPPGTFGLFVTSETQDHVPHAGGSQGTLCLGGTIGRFNAHVFQTSPAGAATFSPDLTRLPVGPGIPAFPGETWTFQAWYRDLNPTVTSNFTDAIAVRFR